MTNLDSQELDQLPDHLNAGDLVSRLVDSDEDDLDPVPPVKQPQEPPPVPKSPPSYQWIYLDPQGKLQGPFDHDDMAEWYSAGYFPEDLMLRRTFDSTFIRLAEMKQLYGRVPFGPSGFVPPPISNTPPPPPQQQQQHSSPEQMQQQPREPSPRIPQEVIQQRLAQQRQQEQQEALLQQQQQQQMLILMDQLKQKRFFLLGQLNPGQPADKLHLLAAQQDEDILHTGRRVMIQQNPELQAEEAARAPIPPQLEINLRIEQLKLLEDMHLRRLSQQEEQQQHQHFQTQQHQQPEIDQNYDPIKSLLNQLQHDDRPASSQSPQQHEDRDRNLSGTRFESVWGDAEQPQQPQQPNMWNQLEDVASLNAPHRANEDKVAKDGAEFVQQKQPRKDRKERRRQQKEAKQKAAAAAVEQEQERQEQQRQALEKVQVRIDCDVTTQHDEIRHLFFL